MLKKANSLVFYISNSISNCLIEFIKLSVSKSANYAKSSSYSTSPLLSISTESYSIS